MHSYSIHGVGVIYTSMVVFSINKPEYLMKGMMYICVDDNYMIVLCVCVCVHVFVFV